MILYPTETVYGLGVGVFDEKALKKLFELKGRDESNSVLWLVRDLNDIKRYADVGELAVKIAKQFLPGPLTLVLPIKKEIRKRYPFLNETVGFRISSDPVAQKTVTDFMEKCDMPLSSTSANISGELTERTVPEILEQFGEKKDMIDEIVDDGERHGLPSTVIELKDGNLIVHREGQIPVGIIKNTLVH